MDRLNNLKIITQNLNGDVLIITFPIVLLITLTLMTYPQIMIYLNATETVYQLDKLPLDSA